MSQMFVDKGGWFVLAMLIVGFGMQSFHMSELKEEVRVLKVETASLLDDHAGRLGDLRKDLNDNDFELEQLWYYGLDLNDSIRIVSNEFGCHNQSYRRVTNAYYDKLPYVFGGYLTVRYDEGFVVYDRGGVAHCFVGEKVVSCDKMCLTPADKVRNAIVNNEREVDGI